MSFHKLTRRQRDQVLIASLFSSVMGEIGALTELHVGLTTLENATGERQCRNYYLHISSCTALGKH